MQIKDAIALHILIHCYHPDGFSYINFPFPAVFLRDLSQPLLSPPFHSSVLSSWVMESVFYLSCFSVHLSFYHNCRPRLSETFAFHFETSQSFFGPLFNCDSHRFLNCLFVSLRVAAHILRNFLLLMVAMHDYYYYVLQGLLHCNTTQSTCRRRSSLILEWIIKARL